MILEAEVVGRFDHQRDANTLVYAPLPSPCQARSTRRYTLEYEGSESAARAFVERTLVEPTSQQVSFGAAPALPATTYILDYGFKPGALDLEKETITNYFRMLPSPEFKLLKLTITQRWYIDTAGAAIPAERFVKDIVNPAVHRHQVTTAA
jgi:hypothetical protein